MVRSQEIGDAPEDQEGRSDDGGPDSRSAGRVLILPATLRDVSYIVANLCDEDRAELECQYPLSVVVEAHAAGEAWCAYLDGQPVQAFGVQALTCSVLTAWAFGTKHRRRTVPAVTRFIRAQVPRWIELGVTRVEARASADHRGAMRWLTTVGSAMCVLHAWGKNGEDFLLFSWAASAWADQSKA